MKKVMVSRFHAVRYYLVAFLAVATAVTARMALDATLDQKAPFLTFTMAVVITAYLGGTRPGLAATLLSLLAARYLFLEPISSFWMRDPPDAIGPVLFAGLGAGISVLCGRLRDSLETAAEKGETTAALLESSAQAVIGIGGDGRIVFVNFRTETLFGYARTELLGQAVEMLVPGRLRESHRSHREEYFELRRNTPLHAGRTLTGRRKDGSEFPVEITLNTIRTRQGRLFVSFVTDISERRRNEAALVRSLELRRLALVAGGMGAWDFHPDTGVCSWDANCSEMFGLGSDARENISFREAIERVHAGDRGAIAEAIADALARNGQSASARQFRVVRADGSIRYLAGYGRVYFSDQNRACPAGIAGVFQDITERKEIEGELYRSRQMLQIILDSIPQNVFWKDRNGRYLGCNRAMACNAGLQNAAEIAGKADQDLPWAASAERYHADDLLVMETGVPKLDFEAQLQRGDGSVRWVRTSKLPLRDAEGRVIGVLGTSEDITGRKQSEEQLKYQYAITSAIAENAAEAVFLLDREGRATFVNAAAERLFGFTRDELLGRVVHDVVHHSRENGKAFPITECPVGQALTRGEVAAGQEGVYFRKDGSPVYVSSSVGPIFRDGRVAGAVNVISDITERRRTEEAVRASEEKYRSLVAHIPDVVWTMDASGRFTYLSPAFETVSGYTPEEVAGGGVQLFYQSIDPASLEVVRESMAALFASGKSYDVECRVQRKDGRWIWIHDRALATYEKDGMQYADGLLSDVTAERTAREALRQSEERYRLLFERNAAGVFRASLPDGRILDCNDAAAQMLGYASPEEALGTLTMTLYAPGPDLPQFLERLRAAKRLSNYEMRLQCKDGAYMWASVNATLTAGADGSPGVVEGTLVEITDRKRAEETRAQETRMAALRGEVGAALTRGGTLRAGLQECAEALVRGTGLAFVRVWTLDKPWTTLILQASAGMYTNIDGGHRAVRVGEFKIGRIAQRRVPHISNQVTEDPEVGDRAWAAREGLASFVGYPLVVEDQVVGVAAAFGRQPLEDSIILFFSSVANQIAQFIHAKHAEQALKQSEERARMLFATIPHPAFVCDLDTAELLEVNDVAVEHYGYSQAQFLHMKVTEIWPGAEPGGWVELLSECHARGTIAQARHRMRDGRAIDVEVNSQYVNYDGRRAALVIAQDITERKKMELDLRHAQKLEAVGGLASGIAHEINTPIQFVGDNIHFLRDAFVSLSEVLQKYRGLRHAAPAAIEDTTLQELERAAEAADMDYLLEEIPKALGQSLDGVQRVATIVKAMKDFAHPEQNEKAAADLNSALTSTLVVARNELKYVADTETDFGALPPVECHLGDMNQVFLNLLVNAAHAIGDVVKGSGRKGTIRVVTRLEGDWVSISIGDTGCGIPEAIRSKVFDPFFTTKGVGRGTGQGLAISRSIVVEKHGGTLTFETEVGRGTVFLIRLPVARPHNDSR